VLAVPVDECPRSREPNWTSAYDTCSRSNWLATKATSIRTQTTRNESLHEELID